VVGHARVASVTDSSTGIRDARRFRQVLRLEDLELNLAHPVPPDPETLLRMRAAPSPASRTAQILVEISEESFKAMTAAPNVERRSDADPEARPDSMSAPPTAGEPIDPSLGRLSG
jgi:hypothetical protein